MEADADADADAEGAGEDAGAVETVGDAGFPLPDESPFVARDMTARRVLLSYELTVSEVRWAGRPAAAEPAAVLAVAAGAAATASDCPSVRAAALPSEEVRAVCCRTWSPAEVWC
ncbi:hypothetical protein GCM10011578_020090 [Streptomyces fuscichromogenes]|uniref:Uncharacterized protein n=1 Tax=Streptomyces fuscichromogenes TaxID=1324013 RepID=A0A918CPZ3_9ACTN|nr:hypothetical protein GCM10011578_020090 [Streptomyces fuscichromogenes]